jgi:hypothetical protein
MFVLGVIFAVVRLERTDWMHCGELPGAAPLFSSGKVRKYSA